MNVVKQFLWLPYTIYSGILFACLILLAFPITLLTLLLPSRVQDIIMFWLLKIISNCWFLFSGILPINYHRKKINFNKSYLLLPNHQSYMDAAIIYTSIPHIFKSLGKKEIEKTPIYGVIYKSVVITVDRSSVHAKATSFRKMKAYLEKGCSILLFPEGTFPSKAQQDLMPFQNGGFTLAIMQQVDILPILFLDTANRLSPANVLQLSPGVNRAVFLPVISVHHLTSKDSDTLKEYTQLYMQTCLDFCKSNSPKHVWLFAVNYLQQQPFVA